MDKIELIIKMLTSRSILTGNCCGLIWENWEEFSGKSASGSNRLAVPGKLAAVLVRQVKLDASYIVSREHGRSQRVCIWQGLATHQYRVLRRSW